MDNHEAIDFQVEGSGTAHHGLDKIQSLIRRNKIDIFITLLDTFMVMENPPNIFLQLDFAPAKTIFYFPSDGEDSLPEMGGVKCHRVLEKVDLPIAMARFGQRQVKELYGLETKYIPHAVFTHIYYPQTPQQKQKLREEFPVFDVNGRSYKGILRDKFIIGSVFRNQPRKMPDRMVLTMALIRDLHIGNLKKIEPEWHYLKDLEIVKDYQNIAFIFHCDPNDPAGQGHNIVEHAIKYNVADKVFFTGMSILDMFPIEQMNDVYNMFDVFFLSTSGEGFGVPTLEAMSCGVPCVVTQGTTTEELLLEDGQSGIPAPHVGHYNNVVGGWTTRRMIMDVYKAVIALNEYYKSEQLRREHGENGRKKAVQIYDWDIIGAQWVEHLERLMEEP